MTFNLSVKMEPAAREFGDQFNLEPESCAILSIAVSLKRIADALSPASEVLTRPVPPPPCGHPAGSAECDECLPF